MFVAGMMAANPEANAANPVLTFLQNTIVPFLDQILALQEQTLQEIKCAENDYCPPAGVDSFETITEVELDLGPLGQGTIPLVGETIVQRSEPDTTREIQTEILSMSLSGSHPGLGDVTLKAGQTFGLPPSTGVITPIPPDSTFPATSFFDVFVEIKVSGLELRNVEPLRIQTDDGNPIKEIPPIETPFTNDFDVELFRVGDTSGEPLGRISEGSVFVPTTTSQAIIKQEIIDLKKDLTEIKDTLGDGGTPPPETDSDGDGFTVEGGDCDDTDPNVNPAASEVCDGLDNDCDGFVPPVELDFDGDGISECAGDCDDTEASIFTGAPEICDGLDNDCNGLVDEELSCNIDYSGSWSIIPTASYSCASGQVDFNINGFDIQEEDGVITFSAQDIGGLTGDLTDNDFEASNHISGTCSETYTIAGTFLDADTFSATLTADYAGSCLDCTLQSFSLTGNRNP